MNIIIAGSRHLLVADDDFLEFICSQYSNVTILSGRCKGADECGEKFAKKKGYRIKGYPADWGRYGKKAGPLRNREMAANADILIAFWNGKKQGSGTWDMIQAAYQYGLTVYIKSCLE